MRIEIREHPSRHLILIPTTDEECRLIEAGIGTAVPARLEGEARLSDGYGTYYLSLSRIADAQGEGDV